MKRFFINGRLAHSNHAETKKPVFSRHQIRVNKTPLSPAVCKENALPVALLHTKKYS
jgi:hypothetical protein